MLTVDASRVATKAKVDIAEHEGNINSLIGEMLPLISHKIEPEYLETTDETIQAIMNIGVTEIIVGEYLKELANDEEEASDFSAGSIKIGENKSVQTRNTRAKEWIDTGWNKLKPYMKSTDYFYFGVG